MKTAEELGRPLSIVKAADDVNNAQKLYMFEKMKKHFSGNLKGKTFAFWGVAFKPNTDDIREAPAIDMAKALVQEGAQVRFYDPVASEHFSAYMKKENVSLESIPNKYDCLNNVDGLVVITEWAEFRAPDFLEMKKRLKTPLIFDARNLFQTHKVLELGFQYYAIGKHIG
jgi:UDPglucose 6-dehydrogenase